MCVVASTQTLVLLLGYVSGSNLFLGLTIVCALLDHHLQL